MTNKNGFEFYLEALGSWDELRKKVEAGELSADEAKELAEDIVDLERIGKLTDAINTNSELVIAFEGLERIISAFFAVL